jgi:hypothetical protein
MRFNWFNPHNSPDDTGIIFNSHFADEEVEA